MPVSDLLSFAREDGFPRLRARLNPAKIFLVTFHHPQPTNPRPVAPVLLAVLAAFGVAFSPQGHAGEIDFNRDVRPVLADKCFSCHGPDGKQCEAELRLDTREGGRWRSWPGI